MKHSSFHSFSFRSDLILLFVVTSLTLFGLLMIYDASSVIAFNLFRDKYHFIKEQLIWVALGFSAMVLFARIDYHKLFNLALPLLIVALGLLLAVFVPGLGAGAKGANRWINLGFFQ